MSDSSWIKFYYEGKRLKINEEMFEIFQSMIPRIVLLS